MLSEKEQKNIVRLVSVLKGQPGGLWIRELSRQAGVHMETARRVIERHPYVFSEYADFTSYRINLKIIKLSSSSINERNVIELVKRRHKNSDSGK